MSTSNTQNNIKRRREEVEYILKEEGNRFSLLPIKHQEIWGLYKKHLHSFWTNDEIDFHQDLKQYNELTDDEKYFIKMILAFFSNSDGIVIENLGLRFIKDIPIAEVRAFYICQMFFEQIHSESYAQMIDTYISDPNEKTELFNAIETVPAIKEKADWALKYIESTDSFAVRVVAFAIVECIQFSGSFCAIAWLKQRGLMPGLSLANQFISRDEGIHVQAAILIYTKYVQNKLSEDEINTMINEAVNIETKFICDSIPCKLIGMNSDLMIQYIQFVADFLVSRLGYRKMFGVECPFEFMLTIELQGKSNFFELLPSEYQRAGEKKFSLDDDF